LFLASWFSHHWFLGLTNVFKVHYLKLQLNISSELKKVIFFVKANSPGFKDEFKIRPECFRKKPATLVVAFIFLS
jgi:hypothetical protein